MSERANAAPLAVALVSGLAIIIATPVIVLVHGLGAEHVRAQAIERGLGEYRVDQKTQAVQFFWKVSTDGKSVTLEKSP